ncbi:Hypothetical protein SRAE_2000456800 [Strongyloides ratti]|uniref:Uncharacterized protein n=1 Tax=Strongyloides ratti TaxID=34506 RepID=A0A090LJA6_STRRB|nr:Hypothetical protein SRAE_2000456800 [Strongyloides ratti]CEF69922.1 Hypothetical protein SRAE_2000456800 [Strongyloides ratti]
MSSYIFYIQIILFIYKIFLCDCFREDCTGHNNQGPCFLYFRPEEKAFGKVLTMLDKSVAITIKKESAGYKKNKDALLFVNGFILRHVDQNTMKTICQRMSNGVVYKNPTILILKSDYENSGSLRRPSMSGSIRGQPVVQRPNTRWMMIQRMKLFRRNSINRAF